jgi:hypothetical protein
MTAWKFWPFLGSAGLAALLALDSSTAIAQNQNPIRIGVIVEAQSVSGSSIPMARTTRC